LGAELPEGYKETPVGVIPEEWECGTISIIATVNPKTNVSGLQDLSPVTFLPMENIGENGRILKWDVRYFRDVKTGYTCFAEKDVLFAKITPCMENGKGALATHLVNGVGCGSTEFHVLRAKISGNEEFIYHLTRFPKFRQQAERFMTGSAGQQRVSKDIFFHYKIGIPPLPEQRRIAAILSSVDAAIQETDAIIAQTEQVKRGLMQELFTKGIGHAEFQETKIGRIPVGWVVAAISSYLSRIIDYRGKTPTKTECGVPLITAKNVREGYYVEEPKEFINPDDFDSWMTRGIPDAGDVMFTTEAPLGNVALIPPEKIALAQRIIVLCPNKEKLDNVLLLYMLLFPSNKARITKRGTGSTVKGIKQSEFRKIKFAFPPFSEQRQIAAILSNVDDKLEAEREHRAQLETVKRGLMQDLLTGKVRVEVNGHE